jgi:hypothetical protein
MLDSCDAKHHKYSSLLDFVSSLVFSHESVQTIKTITYKSSIKYSFSISHHLTAVLRKNGLWRKPHTLVSGRTLSSFCWISKALISTTFIVYQFLLISLPTALSCLTLGCQGWMARTSWRRTEIDKQGR